MEIAIAKRELRKLVKKKLLSLSNSELRSQSLSICEALSNIPEFQNARSVALYMSMPKMEARTLPIIEKCFKRNKKLYLPRCLYHAADGRMSNHLQMLEIPSFEEISQLQPQGKYNLLEPTTGNDLLESKDGLDVIIVPGVAFTTDKKRLGHGAGFYDEFLSTYQTKFGKPPYIIGIGLTQQLVDHIPTEAHDWSLDCIVLGEDVYK
ncbi:5-formyltetrahydrofolate cyclo-ligase [[Candida] railenensis]|uniref:5-formyltetrahydrofolate cyclo-ligase n=1 Tax=[Candida] railenensis TaxID=45579 RepID=A0A9P0QNZ6_9ASCO|nr:5-formyltetrahydrofolate cyclo-ligase [[Candida] railenensis]